MLVEGLQLGGEEVFRVVGSDGVQWGSVEGMDDGHVYFCVPWDLVASS